MKLSYGILIFSLTSTLCSQAAPISSLTERGELLRIEALHWVEVALSDPRLASKFILKPRIQKMHEVLGHVTIDYKSCSKGRVAVSYAKYPDKIFICKKARGLADETLIQAIVHESAHSVVPDRTDEYPVTNLEIWVTVLAGQSPFVSQNFLRDRTQKIETVLEWDASDRVRFDLDYLDILGWKTNQDCYDHLVLSWAIFGFTENLKLALERLPAKSQCSYLKLVDLKGRTAEDLAKANGWDETALYLNQLRAKVCSL